MHIQGYTLANSDKVERALNGTQRQNSNGETFGGVGNGAYFDGTWKKDGSPMSAEEISELETKLLAEYDRLGGLIRRAKDKVKTGSFYDFKGRKSREKAKVSFLFRVNGKEVEVADGVEMPGEVKAARQLERVAEKEEAPEESAPEESTDEAPKKRTKKETK